MDRKYYLLFLSRDFVGLHCLQIEKNALDGCPGIEKEGRVQRRKAIWGDTFCDPWISEIGKPYPSSVAG
jgi:hypothetical protein